MGKILDGFDAKTKEKLIKEVQASPTLHRLPESIRSGIVKEVQAEYGGATLKEEASAEETAKLLDAIMPSGFRKQDQKHDKDGIMIKNWNAM